MSPWRGGRGWMGRGKGETGGSGREAKESARAPVAGDGRDVALAVDLRRSARPGAGAEGDRGGDGQRESEGGGTAAERGGHAGNHSKPAIPDQKRKRGWPLQPSPLPFTTSASYRF